MHKRKGGIKEVKYLSEILVYKEHKLFDIVSDVPLVVDTEVGLNGQLDIGIGDQVITILLGELLIDNNGEKWAVRIEQTKFNGAVESAQGAK